METNLVTDETAELLSRVALKMLRVTSDPLEGPTRRSVKYLW